jgi:predicted methyltransferase
MRMRLTELAQQRVAAVLSAGEFAIDATAGNGHDTVFLARSVGADGRVFAFDVQRTAINSTENRLDQLGLRNVDLFLRSHAELESSLPEQVIGHAGAVMFNLGYLPGGDHAIVTESRSTLFAIDAALRVLRSEGVLTVVAYPGHTGGDVEATRVAGYLAALVPNAYAVERVDGQSGRNTSPVLFVVQKLVSCRQVSP